MDHLNESGFAVITPPFAYKDVAMLLQRAQDARKAFGIVESRQKGT